MTDKDNGNNDVLRIEIESWNGHENSLREENRILFHKMLNECREYVDALNSKGESFASESLFIALIFQQHKMINQLIDKLSKYDIQD